MQTRHLLWAKGTDDTIWCYISNYIMGTVSITCGVKLLSPYLRWKFRGCPFNPSDPISLRLFPAIFYFTFALAAIAGGLVHQFFPHTNEYGDAPLGWEILWRLTVIMTGCAGSALLFTGLNLIATEYAGMQRIGHYRWNLRLYGGLCAVIIAGVNALWGGIAADWSSYYFTAFNFLVGPIFIAIIGLFAQFFWQRLSLPTDRTTFLLYAVTGMVFAIGAIVQVYFSTWCSFENANAEHGCPLPDFFNHNVIMHFIQTCGCVMLFYVTVRHVRKFTEISMAWSQALQVKKNIALKIVLGLLLNLGAGLYLTPTTVLTRPVSPDQLGFH